MLSGSELAKGLGTERTGGIELKKTSIYSSGIVV